jgi:WD40 repeat protein
LQTLEGHGDSVWSVAFSPDSKRIASGSDDKTVKLWDAESGALQSTLEFANIVRQLRFSSDGFILDTDRGNIVLEPATRELEKSVDRVGLCVNDQWTGLNSQRLLRLPPNYRASRVAVDGQRVVLGHSSGGVTLLHFDRAKMLFLN